MFNDRISSYLLPVLAFPLDIDTSIGARYHVLINHDVANLQAELQPSPTSKVITTFEVSDRSSEP